jgi:hypothetical protein
MELIRWFLCTTDGLWVRFLSDASYEGLGGWLPEFQVQWWLTREDLLELGFNLKVVNAVSGEPTPDEKSTPLSLLL